MLAVIQAELLKLHHSRILLVAIAVPLVAVLTGTFNYQLNAGSGIGSGWESLWSQVVVFYSLFFMSMGIAVLAAAVWRMEHQGSNWNALMTTTVPPFRIVTAKTTVLILLIIVMQFVLVAGTWIAGVTIAGLQGAMPALVVPVAALAVVAGGAVAAWQSLLSMLIRSFATPLALGLVGIIVGVVVPMAGYTKLAYVLPYSLVGRTLATGSVAVSDAAGLNLGQVGVILGTGIALIVAGLLVSTWLLRHRDVRI
ncbi:ABC transporter permease [Paeniglutamicibacter antarcticus]|uniref:ABC transporter permease n=1 Tax=Paeniglutamicibacter antarcticus TaxID=494023 RepID=A0ABP9TK68_9MICC